MRVIKAGFLDSMQDLGRFSYNNKGFCNCGAMDAHSLRILNILLGNDLGEAALEMCLFGGEYEFLSDNVFAISGALCNASLNNTPINACKAYRAQRGDILKIEYITGGMYCYLGVSGGFALDKIHGGKSTDLRLGIGGFLGRKLQNGDIIEFEKPNPNIENLEQRFIKNWLEDIAQSAIFNVIKGPQYDLFSDDGIHTFLNSEYTITSNSNRMGLRLQGEPIKHKDRADIPSDGIAFGSIQTPSDGQPIILMADRQISGGYAKIANVISVDLPKLAQTRFNAKIRFQIISIQQAQKLLKQREEAMRDLRVRINKDSI